MGSSVGEKIGKAGSQPDATRWLRSLNYLAGERSQGKWWTSDREQSKKPWLKHYPTGVPAELSYPRERLGWLLEQAFERYPDRIACHYYSQQLTYEELFSRAQRLAAVFVREGLQPGDRVGILLPNLPESLTAHFATWMAGGVVVSLSPLMVADEVVSMIQATDCRFVVTLDILTPLVCHSDQPPELLILSSMAGRLSQIEKLGYAWMRFQKVGLRSPGSQTRVLWLEEAIKGSFLGYPRVTGSVHAPAFVLPTGGTTGAPKAVTLSHHNLMCQAWQLSHWSRGHHGEEKVLAVLPFFHSYGLSASVMTGVAMGSTLIMHHRFRPATVVDLIQEHKPSMMLAVPAMLAALNNEVLRDEDCDMTSLKVIMSGGASLPESVAKEFQEHSGAVIVEGYGLSEASPTTHAGPLNGTAKPGTIGLPLPDTDARVVDPDNPAKILGPGDVGELCVRGPQVMLGYWNNPDATASVFKNGWLHTGDMATYDEEGFFRIVDRIKDLIITSGFNVYPGDVEETLRDYPGIKDVAVVGVPDEERGEVVKAVLVVKSKKEFSQSDFEAFAKEKLAAHKRPRIIEFSEQDLPRNFLGKVLRRQLRELKPEAEPAPPEVTAQDAHDLTVQDT
ncbi:MAG: long-chain fatty acid--CoA ligase [Planctomycetaceae bacterium]|nr:long-chain fatty acid--CoA ligase [Planctomycetaceae bacterium]